MAGRLPLRAILMAAALAGVGSMPCVAQRYVPPPPPLAVDPCAVHPNPKFPVAPDPKAKTPVCPPPSATRPDAPAPSNAKPSSAEQFPFPGEAGSGAAAQGAARPAGQTSPADKFPYPGSDPAPAGTPATPAAGGSAGQFPYPGETSKSPDAVPEGDTPCYVPDSPAPGGSAPPPKANAADDGSSSSSSSSGDSPAIPTDDRDKAAVPDDGSDAKTANVRRRLPKVSAQSSDERVSEDLDVAKFYSGHGNFEAAYLRSKDAATVMPNDPESHFALAQSAQKLRKNEEAVAEYTLYLKLDPAGDHTAVAQKALSDLH